MDASGIEIVQGASRWLPTPNASEIFVINFSPEGVQLQTEHVGVVVYRSDDQPSLRLVHHIHTVRAPDGSITTNHGGFGITCIAPER